MRKFWKYVKQNLLTREMILPLILGEATFWSPFVVLGLLALLVSPYYWTVFGMVYSIWVFALPAIPIQLSLIFLYKKLIFLIKRKENNNE